MNKPTHHVLSLFFCMTIGIYCLNAQDISINYTNPENIIVCEPSLFTIILANNTDDTDFQDINLSIVFPESVAYIPSSIDNATELDINNPSAPIFEISNLLAGESLTLTLSAWAKCDAIDAIDSGILFFNEITVNYDGNETAISTTPYDIETPFLVIIGVSGESLAAGPGETIVRTVYIQNTRLGALSSFVFRDENDGNLVITSPVGNTIISENGLFELELTGDDFAQVGNGNNLLELGEAIGITQEITIDNCVDALDFSFSQLSVSWGCDGENCEAGIGSAKEAIVNFEESTLVPELSVTPLVTLPLCYNGNAPTRQQLGIVNTGVDLAKDINITLFQKDTLGFNGGIGSGTLFLDSAGVITPLNPVLVDPSNPVNSCMVSGYFNELIVSFDQLSVGDSVTLNWDIFICNQNCDNNFIEWEYALGYYSSCEPAIFLGGEGKAESSELMNSTLEATSGSLQDEELTSFHYTLSSEALEETDASLAIEIRFPCAAEWQENDLSVDGQVPDTSLFFTAGDVYLTAIYQLPISEEIALDFDLIYFCESDCLSGCVDSLVTSCDEVCAPPLEAPINVFVQSAMLVGEGCGASFSPKSCAFVTFPTMDSLRCEVDYCYDTIPAYIDYDFDIFRTNFGLPDNDNNQIADGGGTINMDLVKDERIIAGDTIRGVLKSMVVNDYEAHPAEFVQLNLPFVAPNAITGGNGDLISPESLEELSNELKIYDYSAGSYYICNNVPTIDDALFRYDFSLPTLIALGCNIPDGYRYENRDSIIFVSNYKVNYNPLPEENDVIPPIYEIRIGPTLAISKQPIQGVNYFNCGCSSERIYISGYNINIEPGIIPVPPCSSSGFVGGNSFQFLLGEDNFFPYEHRNLCTLQEWTIQLPEEFSLMNSQIDILRMQNGSEILSDIPITMTALSDNQFSINLSPFEPYPLDEGFAYTFQFDLETNCYFLGFSALDIVADVSLAANLPDGGEQEIFASGNSLRSLSPTLDMTIPASTISTNDNQASWMFSLTNNPTQIASTFSGTAEYCWVYVESPTGNLTDFELIDQNTGLPLPDINGIFQLPDIPAEASQPLKLKALNQGCETESLIVKYGWNCDPYENPLLTACASKFQFLFVTASQGELDMEVISPQGPFPLCGTIPAYEVAILNAEIGTTYALELSAILPPGLEIVSGSSRVAYPTGTTFEPVSDPQLIGSNELLWDFSLLSDSIALNGLSGILEEPANQITLQFETKTNCDFIAGSYLIFNISAAKNCGEPTNTITKASDPILIDGVAPPYTGSIAILQQEELICEDEAIFEISLEMNDVLLVGDSIIMELPDGVFYISNSYNVIENALLMEPVILEETGQQTLKWPLPNGLPAGEQLAFEFGLEGFAALDCGQEFIRVQSVAKTTAFCATENTDCDILVETASNLFPLNINRPLLDITMFDITINEAQTILDYEVMIENAAYQSAVPVVVDFYTDNDGDGIVSGGDDFIFSDSIQQVIFENESVLLEGSLLWNAADGFCNLLAHINSETQCLCEGTTEFVGGSIGVVYEAIPTLCSGGSVTIGVPEIAGHIYQWMPQESVTCPNCATTEITLTNTFSNIYTEEVTLVEDTGENCYFNHHFNLSVYPEPDITAASDIICAGESIGLTAVEGESYLWSGVGVYGLTSRTVTVSPIETTTYEVLITNDENCAGTASITITVSEGPVADAGDDQFFCEGLAGNLNAVFNQNYTYNWSPATQLSNPTVHDPVILLNIPTTYALTVTDEHNCTNTDVVNIDFGLAPALEVSPDVVICDGGTAVLTATGNGSFQWMPSSGLSCDDCPEVIASPVSSMVYTVVLTGASGCTDAAEIFVSVEDFIATSETQTICDGETILIFDELIGTAGEYCKTFDTAICDSVHCVVLELLDTIIVTTYDTICLGESLEFNNEIYEEPGLYCLSFSSDHYCDSTHCLNLSFYELPETTITEDTSIALGDEVPLAVSGGITYEWSPAESLDCSDCPDPIATPTESTIYEVIITDENACSTTMEVEILVETSQSCTMAVPTIFIPNGQAENNSFRLITAAEGAAGVELMQIYNRWGKKIYESTASDASWDGTVKGRLAPADVYFFILSARCFSNDKIYPLQGELTLMR